MIDFKFLTKKNPINPAILSKKSRRRTAQGLLYALQKSVFVIRKSYFEPIHAFSFTSPRSQTAPPA